MLCGLNLSKYLEVIVICEVHYLQETFVHFSKLLPDLGKITATCCSSSSSSEIIMPLKASNCVSCYWFLYLCMSSKFSDPAPYSSFHLMFFLCVFYFYYTIHQGLSWSVLVHFLCVWITWVVYFPIYYRFLFYPLLFSLVFHVIFLTSFISNAFSRVSMSMFHWRW